MKNAYRFFLRDTNWSVVVDDPDSGIGVFLTRLTHRVYLLDNCAKSMVVCWRLMILFICKASTNHVMDKPIVLCRQIFQMVLPL